MKPSQRPNRQATDQMIETYKVTEGTARTSWLNEQMAQLSPKRWGRGLFSTGWLNGKKNGKAPGGDGACAEILKAEDEETPQILQGILQETWDSEEIPVDFIAKIPKKGELSDCNNIVVPHQQSFQPCNPPAHYSRLHIPTGTSLLPEKNDHVSTISLCCETSFNNDRSEAVRESPRQIVLLPTRPSTYTNII